MPMNLSLSLRTVSAAAAVVLTSGFACAQTPAPSPASAPASTPAPAPAPSPKPWHIGPMNITGFADGYYSWNDNHPTNSANGETNDLYNFNTYADQPDLSVGKVTLNHDPAPVGARVDMIFGRTNKLMNAPGQLEYVEQAYLSVKPPKAKGFELDLGKFVTSAGAEVIEAKDNWNYSRSLLFAWAIPYWHFGVRTSMPVSKSETVGLQVVNGWNNITKSTGGVTVGLTSAFAQPKYTWSANFYTGPENTDAQHAYRNLFDTTVLFTPTSKLNWYLNYDLGFNNDSISKGMGDNVNSHWQGVAVAAHEQITSKIAGALRAEIFNDAQGYSTGTPQTLKEFTGTYEYKWKHGLISRAEYRHDWSDTPSFHKSATQMVDQQSTLSIGMILVLQPGQ